jgi:hypothetical protein
MKMPVATGLASATTQTNCPWVVLYVERWLKAPIQLEDGRVVLRTSGTPQGIAPDDQQVLAQRAIPARGYLWTRLSAFGLQFKLSRKPIRVSAALLRGCHPYPDCAYPFASGPGPLAIGPFSRSIEEERRVQVLTPSSCCGGCRAQQTPP